MPVLAPAPVSANTTALVPVVTPDYSGGLETGYALAVEAMRAKMVGDTKSYAELMERINRGEGATD